MEKQTMSDDRFLDTAPVSLDGPGMSIEFMSADLLERVKKEELSVEEAFAALDQIVQKMEEEGISLEDSFNCYETGIRLVRYCSERIDRVEKKVQMLRGDGQAPMDEANT